MKIEVRAEMDDRLQPGEKRWAWIYEGKSILKAFYAVLLCRRRGFPARLEWR